MKLWTLRAHSPECFKRKVNLRSSLYLSFALMICACSKHRTATPVNRFADSTYVRLADFQDRRMADSLLPFIEHPDAQYREQALIALGSVQDSTKVQQIALMLGDSEARVRYAAAFALGQTRCRQSERVLREAISTEKDVRVLARLYESYGRATAKWDISEIPADTVAAAGFAWGLFRTSGDSLLNPLATEMLRSPSATVRLGATSYFASKAPHPMVAEAALIALATKERNEEIRMAATLGLKKLRTDTVLATLRRISSKDPSYRVRVNAVSALQTFSTAAKPILMSALRDQNVNVAIRAAEVMNTLPPDKSSWKATVTLARASTNVRVKALLYQYAMTSADEEQDLFKEIRSLYSLASDPYTKAALLKAMGKTLMAFSFAVDEMKNADTASVRTAAAAALVEMNYNEDFTPALKNVFAKTYRDAVDMNDLAVTSNICRALSDPQLGYKSVVKDWSFLYDAKSKLNLPEDNETLQGLNSAIAYFEDKKFPPEHSEFYHPIDWHTVHSIRSDQQAVIATSKGIITIQLLVDEAPGSVANFVKLVHERAYNDTFFHRVVPNFVAQGGCPRGDGYGSKAYSIRSEFSLRRYKTGSVGLASSGKDTESMQWFITHSPTPHLDGAYTIFAEVVDGMEIVHQLEVGDRILNIELPQ